MSLKNFLLVLAYLCITLCSCKNQNYYYSKDISTHRLNRYLWLNTSKPWPGTFDKVKECIERGADIEYVDEDETLENTPFLNAAGAIAYANENIHKKRPAADIDSMESEAIRIVKYLAAQGANVHAVEPHRELNALHQAAIGGRARMIPVLVDLGLDINSTDKNGGTPLLHAIGCGNLETVKAIVKAGGNIDYILPSDGNSVLDYAQAYSTNKESQAFAYYDNFDAVAKYLEKIGAKHGANNWEGNLYFHN